MHQIAGNLELRILFGTLFFLLAATPAAADDLFDQVAPVLEKRCLRCHNDQLSRGGFSLQSRQQAFASGWVEAGDPDNSYLIELITPIDGAAEMPKSAKPLTDSELGLFRDWVAAGAHWPDDFQFEPPEVNRFDWWSFRPLTAPHVPPLEDDWVRTPIDAFALRQLQAKGMRPAPPADRRTLLRRLKFDLTGLPPTHTEVEAFVADPDPQAYEKWVERFLASPDYGERWARHWLDVVQYADTCGYDKDKLRPHAWPYRDYVIRSFNDDKPYWRFIQEQIAGDALFPGDPDGILGLGFLAAGPWDFIGHVEVPESKIDGQVARNLDRNDMVANTINTFCSLTIQCARCHDHKFDPFTQEHYYGLQSVFAALDRANRVYDVDPQVDAQRSRLSKQIKEAEQVLKQLDRRLLDAGGAELADLRNRVHELKQQVSVKQTSRFGFHSQLAKTPDETKWLEVELKQPQAVSQIVLRPCYDDFAAIGAGFGFPLRFKLEGSLDDGEWVMLADRTGEDQANPGLNPLTLRFNEQELKKIRLTATKLRERKNDFMLALAELEVLDANGRNAAEQATVRSLDSIEAPERWSRNNLVDNAFPSDPDGSATRLRRAQDQLAGMLAKLESGEHRRQVEETRTRIEVARKALAKLPAGKRVYAAATEFASEGHFKPTGGKPRPVRVLHRGDITQPGELARPGKLPFAEGEDVAFQALDSEADRRRQLAQWLTRDEHPLVWRSIVNRIWQYHFGRGLVGTPNDFGRMGERPSHPDLLDWLAVEFRDGGQSFKQLHRLIVTSNVYRQSSSHQPAHAEQDAENRLLWRMNRRRLEAEEIRDAMLAVSGALDRTRGGPGYYFFDLQKTEHSPHFEYHLFDPADPASHRRSIYRFVVRSQPDPWMTVLDCADSSQSTPRRNETLTPLQALTLLNNGFNLEMANRMAAELEAQTDSPREQLTRAIRQALQRDPTETELNELAPFLARHGLAAVCRMLFNLSEFMYVD